MVAPDPAGGGDEADGLVVTVIEGEGNSDPLAIIEANLKSIGAPAAVCKLPGRSGATEGGGDNLVVTMAWAKKVAEFAVLSAEAAGCVVALEARIHRMRL